MCPDFNGTVRGDCSCEVVVSKHVGRVYWPVYVAGGFRTKLATFCQQTSRAVGRLRGHSLCAVQCNTASPGLAS